MMPGCRAFVREDSSRPFNQGVCVGVVRTVVSFSRDVCEPRDSTVGQAIRVVVQYIDSRPAQHHEDFADLAKQALKAAWPCRQN